ncbi:MAG TPA: DMT family transporter [Chloroflexaceae bacterium]|nr:DMT family transporter [Chloroflexaceae bacterium]
MQVSVQSTCQAGRARRLLIVLGLTLVYALCFVAIKAGLAFAPPLRFAALRGLVGGAALLGLLVASRRTLMPPRDSWPWITALAATATTVAFGAMFLSPGRTGAGVAAVLGNLQPVLVPALAATFLGERMSGGKWTALLLGLAGGVLIAAPAFAGPAGVDGPLLALAASLGLAASSIIAKRMQPQLDVLQLTAWQLVAGSLPLLLVSAIMEAGVAIAWNSSFLGLLLFLALPGTAVANAVWYWLIRRGDVGRLSMFFFLVPVLGLLLGATVFAEPIGLLEGIGVGLTLAGIGAIAWEALAAQEP